MAISEPARWRSHGERSSRSGAVVWVRRRRLRADLLQLVGIAVGLALGLAMPTVSVGPTTDASAASQLLIGISAGVLTFVGLVYSLLFLVVQFGSTNLTPRLNLFRDDPLVWRASSFFIGLIVWAVTASMAAAGRERVSTSIVAAALLGVLVALALFRRLQLAAFASIQLAPTLRDVGDHGRRIIDALYTEQLGTPGDLPPLPSVRAHVRWAGRGGILQRIDLPALMEASEAIEGVVELTVTPGDTVREQGIIAVVRGGHGDVPDRRILAALELGLERTFDQDPRFAFRLFGDIAIRALSPAINDQATAVQVIDAIDDLIARLCRRRLDIGRIHGLDGQMRVIVPVPRWDEYLDIALADVVRAGADVAPVTQRLLRLLDDLEADAAPSYRPAIARWRTEVAGPPAT